MNIKYISYYVYSIYFIYEFCQIYFALNFKCQTELRQLF